MPDDEEKKVDAQQEYDLLSSIEPERLETVADDGIEHKTVTEQQAASPKLTDMQAADKRLFPEFLVPWLNHLQVSRITPETYIPMKTVLVMCVLEEYPGLSFGEVQVMLEAAMSIGLDGEGRIDELTLVGASAAKEAAKNKGLELP